MKKILLLGFFFVGLFAKPIVSVSIPPQAFFVQQIAGDSVEINTIVPPNTDEHNLDFKPATMMKLEKSDIYFTIGLEFEKPMLYKFKDNFKNLKIIDTRQNLKLAYTTFEHSHKHKEGEEHEAHHHEAYEYEHKIAPSVFDDSEVKDRNLGDWEGEFKSVYPYLLDNSLDSVFDFRAGFEGKSAKEIKDYYAHGYKSDVLSINIKGDTMTFKTKSTTLSAKYAYKGFKIFTYESGKKGVRYQFEAVDKNTKAPKFIQFSDHQINPTKVSHFHIYMGNDGFDKLSLEMHNWPTFYTASLSKDEIIADLIAHLDMDKDPHIWLDPILVKIQAQNITNALSEQYPQNKALYEKNLARFNAELDELDATIRQELSGVKNRKFIVYHPSWGYFAARYNLTQIPVEIEGKEPKINDLRALINTAKNEKITTIFVQAGFPDSMARTLARECGAKVVAIDHLSSDWKNELLKSVAKLKNASK